MRIAYIRVSTDEQNTARQYEALKQYDIERFFEEKISAKDMNRPELKAMLSFAREGDVVYVEDFSRLARSTKDLLSIVEELKEKRIDLVSLKEKLDSATPQGKLMLTMIGAINEFERENILERQREGIALAKREGKYKGRKPIKIDESKWHALYEQYLRRDINKVEFAQELNVSRPTLDRLLKTKME